MGVKIGPDSAVVLETGDDKQFQAVAYGDALGMARTIEPGVDMTTTMRQKTHGKRAQRKICGPATSARRSTPITRTDTFSCPKRSKRLGTGW